MKVVRFGSRGELDVAVADMLAVVVSNASFPHPHAVMLSGGSTPFPAFHAVSTSGVKAAPGLHLMFSDDRHVPMESPDSNLGNTQPMIQALAVPAGQVLHVRSELALPEAATDYAGQLGAFLAAGGSIELGLLGMGADGHTCSIFTMEAAAITNCLAFAVPNQGGFDRVSVSRAVLLKTKRIVIMVAGEGKAAIVRQLLTAPESLPCGVALAGHPAVELWTDVPV